MCKPTSVKGKAPSSSRTTSTATATITKSITSYMSLEAFQTKPSAFTVVVQSTITLLILKGIEVGLLTMIEAHQDFHPLLEIDLNRRILARHVGTDWLCCMIVAVLGISSFRSVCPEFLEVARGVPGAMAEGGYEARMFTYHPKAMRLVVFFWAYQLKNMYDTIVWQDGPEFIAHHVMCLAVAYGLLRHGFSLFHVPFYFGISEISTGILCLLANFEDEHGVPGLAEAFPMGKVVLGAGFAVLFIICRVFLWAFFTKYYIQDARLTLAQSSREEVKPWIKIFLVSLTGLTTLQIIWLGTIIYVGKTELEQMFGQ